jgi:hypothetical protein
VEVTYVYHPISYGDRYVAAPAAGDPVTVLDLDATGQAYKSAPYILLRLPDLELAVDSDQIIQQVTRTYAGRRTTGPLHPDPGLRDRRLRH